MTVVVASAAVEAKIDGTVGIRDSEDEELANSVDVVDEIDVIKVVKDERYALEEAWSLVGCGSRFVFGREGSMELRVLSLLWQVSPAMQEFKGGIMII
jgi:hypothetical protein